MFGELSRPPRFFSGIQNIGNFKFELFLFLSCIRLGVVQHLTSQNVLDVDWILFVGLDLRHRPRQPIISNLDPALGVDEEVSWLEVPMNDIGFV